MRVHAAYATRRVWRVFTVCVVACLQWGGWMGPIHYACRRTCALMYMTTPLHKPIIHRPDHYKTASRPLPAPALRDGRLRGRLPVLRPARPAPNAPGHDALPGVFLSGETNAHDRIKSFCIFRGVGRGKRALPGG